MHEVFAPQVSIMECNHEAITKVKTSKNKIKNATTQYKLIK